MHLKALICVYSVFRSHKRFQYTLIYVGDLPCSSFKTLTNTLFCMASNRRSNAERSELELFDHILMKEK